MRVRPRHLAISASICDLLVLHIALLIDLCTSIAFKRMNPFEILRERGAHIVCTSDINARNRHVDIFLVDESEMREINFRERGFDRSTDVLSFPFYSVSLVMLIVRRFPYRVI